MKDYKRYACLVIILALSCLSSYSQIIENSGWFLYSQTQALSGKFDLSGSVQIQSSNHYAYLGALSLTGTLGYNFNEKHSVAAGYNYRSTWNREIGETAHSVENRLFEQYAHKFKRKNTDITLRGRLEQRFIQREEPVFSQRLRAYINAKLPVSTNKDLTKGLFAVLRNELFLNIQNKDMINQRFIDQERPYVGVDYRCCKQADTQIGYMPSFQHKIDGNYVKHIVQVSVSTNFK